MHAEIDFLPAALEIQEKPPSPAGRAVIWSIVVFFSIAVLWAFLGSIDIVATAQGKIIPSGRVKIIQPMEIGVVRYIHVEEGQQVKAGDVLLELDPTATQADLGRLDMDLIDARLDDARFKQLIQMATAQPDDGNRQVPIKLQLAPELTQVVNPAAINLQQQMLISNWNEHQAQSAALKYTIRSREAELAALQEDVKKRQGTLPLITRRADALKKMADKRLSSEQAWLEIEEERIEQQHELAAIKSRTRQMTASIQEAQQQVQALNAAYHGELLASLSETERRIDQLQQERVKATQRNELQRLVSPVNGVIQQLAIHTIGGVVTPAQELMKIVPESETLEVEAWILNKDIGFIHDGQIAEVKIETFPFTKYGTIDAEVIDVSNDAVNDEQKGLVYAGRVRMEDSEIRVGEKLVSLSPGMAVTVEVKTGKRRLIEYIMSPLLRYKQESLGER